MRSTAQQPIFPILILMVTVSVSGCSMNGESSRQHLKRVLPGVVVGHGKQGYVKPKCFLGYHQTTWHPPESFGGVCNHACNPQCGCHESGIPCDQPVLSDGQEYIITDAELIP